MSCACIRSPTNDVVPTHMAYTNVFWKKKASKITVNSCSFCKIMLAFSLTSVWRYRVFFSSATTINYLPSFFKRRFNRWRTQTHRREGGESTRRWESILFPNKKINDSVSSALFRSLAYVQLMNKNRFSFALADSRSALLYFFLLVSRTHDFVWLKIRLSTCLLGSVSDDGSTRHWRCS